MFNHEVSRKAELVWKRQNSFLEGYSKENTGPTEIKLDNDTFTGRKLAGRFNNFFASVASSVHNTSCMEFMPSRARESAYLFPVSQPEVVAVFLSLKNSYCADKFDRSSTCLTSLPQP